MEKLRASRRDESLPVFRCGGPSCVLDSMWRARMCACAYDFLFLFSFAIASFRRVSNCYGRCCGCCGCVLLRSRLTLCVCVCVSANVSVRDMRLPCNSATKTEMVSVSLPRMRIYAPLLLLSYYTHGIRILFACSTAYFLLTAWEMNGWLSCTSDGGRRAATDAVRLRDVCHKSRAYEFRLDSHTVPRSEILRFSLALSPFRPFQLIINWN